jgi:hypothetical protein
MPRKLTRAGEGQPIREAMRGIRSHSVLVVKMLSDDFRTTNDSGPRRQRSDSILLLTLQKKLSSPPLRVPPPRQLACDQKKAPLQVACYSDVPPYMFFGWVGMDKGLSSMTSSSSCLNQLIDRSIKSLMIRRGAVPIDRRMVQCPLPLISHSCRE